MAQKLGRTPIPIPSDACLDDALEQEHAHMDVWFLKLATGERVAWNGSRRDMDDIPHCVICGGDPEKMPDCAECRGTGLILYVPFCPRPWDEVVAGLWIGGHDCQPSRENPTGACIPKREFDAVFSLYQRYDYGPAEGIPNVYFRMADSDLDPEHHTALDDMADQANALVQQGKKVLIRCQAGMNRSGLVTALVLKRMGWSADDAIARIRDVRSPYCLFNPSFVRYLQEESA